jgi:hypothetical protein
MESISDPNIQEKHIVFNKELHCKFLRKILSSMKKYNLNNNTEIRQYPLTK